MQSVPTLPVRGERSSLISQILPWLPCYPTLNRLNIFFLQALRYLNALSDDTDTARDKLTQSRAKLISAAKVVIDRTKAQARA